MKILRFKTFSRRDEIPENRFDAIPVDLVGKINSISVEIDQTKRYSEDMSKLGPVDKAKVRALRKDVKNRFLYTDGPNGGDTHYLADFSNKEKHWLSKAINTTDRMNYIVYPPVFDEKSGTLTIRVSIQSLLSHLGPGQKNYSGIIKIQAD